MIDFAQFHLILHFALPVLLAYLFYRFYPNKKNRGSENLWPQVKRASLLMIVTMLVDLDHLLAQPIYSPGRCSIGFHPLHQEWAILLYALLLCYKPARWPALGLLLHMLLDGLDCIY